MQAEQLANLFERSKREGNAWRARCPVHKSKALTLGIYPKEERSILVCYAGCREKDILAAVNLTWKDLLYVPLERLSRESWQAQQRVREAKELLESNLRIGTWILRFADRGYTLADRERDVIVSLSASALLVAKPERHREVILRTAMERIAAADHCRMRGMLPNVCLDL
jgi:hypothetical protein